MLMFEEPATILIVSAILDVMFLFLCLLARGGRRRLSVVRNLCGSGRRVHLPGNKGRNPMEYFRIQEPLVMFYITKTEAEWGGPQGSVESGWRINRNKAERHGLYLARDNDIITGAYCPLPDSWEPQLQEDGQKGRRVFRVTPALDLWDDYVGKLDPPGLNSSSNRPVVRYATPTSPMSSIG